MGYLLTVGVNLPDDEWREIVRIARARGVLRTDLIAPPGTGRYYTVVLGASEARSLAQALEADLDDDGAPVRHVPKDRVESVARILRAGERVHLGQTPRWKSGDEAPDVGGER
jgi:hypothetical protein